MKKCTLFIIIFVIGTTIIRAQDQSYKRLSPFNNEKFTERLDEYKLTMPDTMKLNKEMPALNYSKKHAIRSLEVHENEMAQMPKMEIKKDQHYTMLIKRYSLHYPYEPNFNLDSIAQDNKKTLQPIRKPKE